jgi:hypothetical protein
LVALFMIGGCQQGPPPSANGTTFAAGDGLEYAPGVQGEVKTITVTDFDGNPFSFSYEVIDGLAIVGGDMIIGVASDFEDADEVDVTPESNVMARRVCWYLGRIELYCKFYRWYDAVVPYAFANDWNVPGSGVDENAMMVERVFEAMRQIEAVTAVRFIPRIGHPDYVRFRSSDGCSSWVGRQGGRQNINLSVDCGLGATIHEILHAIGLHHEHTREDRNDFVAIQWANIRSGNSHNFEKDDLSYDFGPYDYRSIMHYRAHAFCIRDADRNCIGPTIVTVPPGTPIGYDVMSAGDIASVNRMYPGEPPSVAITSPSPGSSFRRQVDGLPLAATVVDPEGFEVAVTWSSNISGPLGSGNALTVGTAAMAYGTHLISARAEDPQGNVATATVAITITNDPPTVDLYQPPAGTFCVGEPIGFRAAVVDLNEPGFTLPDASVAWREGAHGTTFATGKSVTHAFGTAGSRWVYVRATDGGGLHGEDGVNLVIVTCTSQPPEVTITDPPADVELEYHGFDAARGQWYRDVTLSGTAIDPEDGALSGAALVWTTDRSDIQTPQLGTGNTIHVRLYSNLTGGVTHTITLTATDGDGNARSDVRRIRIWTVM